MNATEEGYIALAELTEELSGQELRVRTQGASAPGKHTTALLRWKDGAKQSVVAQAASQAAAMIAVEGALPVRIVRELTGRTRVELVVAAARKDPNVLEGLREASEISPGVAASGAGSRRGAVIAVVEQCAQILQGVPACELELPITQDGGLLELAALAMAITPQSERDLSVLPDALKTAQHALAEV